MDLVPAPLYPRPWRSSLRLTAVAAAWGQPWADIWPDFDRVIVLDRGEIVEGDRPRELLTDRESILGRLATAWKMGGTVKGE